MPSLEPRLFCGSSHPELGHQLSSLSGIPLGKISLGRFPDGEIAAEILEDVQGRDVFVLQTVAKDPNTYLMELFLIIDALKRSSVRNVFAIVPYFGYCRQDRKDRPGVPIAAKLVANLLQASGSDRLITVDLHAAQLEGFFDLPVDHLMCMRLFIEEIKKLGKKDWVVVAPDIGSVKVAEKMALLLDTELAVVTKKRVTPYEVHMRLIGNVQGKDVLIADDMCSTGGTLLAAADLCRKEGSGDVTGVITHGLFVDDALEKIRKSCLKHLYVTNSVPSLFSEKDSKIIPISIAPLISDAMRILLQQMPNRSPGRSLGSHYDFSR